MKTARAIAAMLLALVVGVQATLAQAGLPVVDKPRYLILIKDLQALSEQMRTWGGLVGAARDQIQTLQALADGIRSIQGGVSGGIRGIAGELSSAIGLNETLAVLGEVQNVYTDAQTLVRDIRALPEEAKRRLADIGFATEDVQIFLRDGLMYETMSNLGADQWRQVAANPARALQNGSFGVALTRCDSYLSPNDRSQAWHNYIGSLSDEDKATCAGIVGPQFAAHLADEWFVDMAKRTAAVVEMKAVANQITQKVDAQISVRGTDDDPGKAISSDLVTANGALAMQLKIESRSMLDYSRAAQTLNASEKERTRLLHEMWVRDNAADSTAAMKAARAK